MAHLRTLFIALLLAATAANTIAQSDATAIVRKAHQLAGGNAQLQLVS